MPGDMTDALDFMKATTELSAPGTRQDSGSVSTEVWASDVRPEVEYGEVECDLVGDGIVRALSVINNLGINEQVLSTRRINIEQATLIAERHCASLLGAVRRAVWHDRTSYLGPAGGRGEWPGWREKGQGA